MYGVVGKCLSHAIPAYSAVYDIQQNLDYQFAKTDEMAGRIVESSWK